MSQQTKTFISILSTFFGTTIGVGIFALPFVYHKTLGFSLVVLAITGVILTKLYSMYIDVLVKKGVSVHQLSGIVAKLFGKRAKHLSTVG